jgi:hypothetical protein
MGEDPWGGETLKYYLSEALSRSSRKEIVHKGCQIWHSWCAGRETRGWMLFPVKIDMQHNS